MNPVQANGPAAIEREAGRRPPAWALGSASTLDRLRSRPGRLRLALTGGIASGKSTGAAVWEELGAVQIDFDLLARQAVEPGSSGAAEAARLLGPAALNPDGSLNRAETARLVFAEPAKREALEAIIHPRCWSLLAERLAELGERPALVISIPLLFEAGLAALFQPVVLVSLPAWLQLRRLLGRSPHLTEAEALRIMASQSSQAAKAAACDFIIDNSRGPQELRSAARELWAKLQLAYELE